MFEHFALILVVLTLLTGVVVGLDRLFWRKARVGASGQPQADPWLVDWSRSLFPVLLIVLVFRSFLFEPFKIPSGSMIPTLLVGDYIVVNKFAYGLRLPVGHYRFLETGDPERGDVVVFRFPLDNKTNYIKRMIGLPGDRVDYRNKQLYINGEPVEQSPIGTYTRQDSKCAQPRPNEQRRQENIGGVQHDILVREDYNRQGQLSWTVPEGHYFVMGDNRDNSNDSREWGFVPEANLVGRAVRIWLNFDYHQGCLDWSRVGDRIE